MEKDNILRDFNGNPIQLKDRIITCEDEYHLSEGRVVGLDYSEKTVIVKLDTKINSTVLSPQQVLVYNIDEAHEWESLYYKENAEVGLLRTEIKSLKSQIDYLNSKIAYIQKYREEI